ALAQQYQLQRRVHSGESVSKVLFATAIRLARNRRLVDPGPDVAERRQRFAVEIRDALRRIDAISALGQARRGGADRLTARPGPTALALVPLLLPARALAQPGGFVDRLYAVAGRPTLWVANGGVDARARAVIAALAGAPAHGLDPADYGAAELAA